MANEQAPIGILTVSDRAFRGEYEDLGGPAVHNWLKERFSEAPPFVLHLVPDDLDAIEQLHYILDPVLGFYCFCFFNILNYSCHLHYMPCQFIG